ncbi:MAG: LysM peptidoglycan-binding domain-containing protein [Alphaproteobacteria bacterium]|nr:LysM peptidoglycan-binding domain-containing protein [Alphaproteobacteria bacterium]
MYKSLLIKISFTTAFCFFMLGCERSAPSPVEIKIDNYVSGTHTVFNNETLYDIAYRYNIDPINLAKINKLNPPYQLKNGQVLQLPTSDMNLSKKSQTNEADTENIEMKNVGYVAIDDD